MNEIPWAAIQTEWRERRQGATRGVVEALGEVPVGEVDALLSTDEPPEPERAAEVLERAFTAVAAADPDGELLLALHVYGLCLERWENSEDYRGIRTVVTALGEVHDKRAQEPASTRGRLLATLVSQAKAMDDELGVEEAMNCSCPIAMGGRAESAVKTLRTVIAEFDRLERSQSAGFAELRGVARADAEASLSYFERIVDVADAVRDFVYRDAPGPFELGHVLERLEATERDPAIAGDVFESELRSHRAALVALGKQAPEARLRIDAADVLYLYPFTLAVDHDETVKRARSDEVARALGARPGLQPKRVRKLVVNDIWDRPDRDEAGYGGTTIELPDVRVEPAAYRWLRPDEREHSVIDCTVEVRLSRLGNHYVCVRSKLKDASPHVVNQALRRGSPAMGAEMLWAKGRKEHWKGFTDYVKEVIAAIASDLGVESVTNLNATFHVVLAARSISVERENGSPAPATPGDLEHAVGATLLFHPVRHLTGSLQEWVRYPPPEVRNLLGREGYADDLVAQTENTTVTFMPASPDWLAAEYLEMIQFVESLPPLFSLWERRAKLLAVELEERLQNIEELIKDDIDPIDELYEQERKIRRLESSIRRQLAFLRSPDLCRTRGQRQFLDGLWDAAGLEKLVRELDWRLSLLAKQQERMAAMWPLIDARKRRQQQERATRHEQEQRRRASYLGFVLGALGVFSVAGVFEWLNHVFGLGGDSWGWGEAAFFGLVLLGVLAAYLQLGVDRGESEPPA